jgi:hypothetical protein
VAALRGEPSGMASGVPLLPVPHVRPPREPGALELISLWVAPSARGHGVADALIEDIVAWAVGLRSPAVWLSVREDNASAIALYRRRGFEATGERILEASRARPSARRGDFQSQCRAATLIAKFESPRARCVRGLPLRPVAYANSRLSDRCMRRDGAACSTSCSQSGCCRT